MDPVLQFDSFPLLSTLFFTATVLPAWVAAQCVKKKTGVNGPNPTGTQSDAAATNKSAVQPVKSGQQAPAAPATDAKASPAVKSEAKPVDAKSAAKPAEAKKPDTPAAKSYAKPVDAKSAIAKPAEAKKPDTSVAKSEKAEKKEDGDEDYEDVNVGEGNNALPPPA